MIIDKKTIDKNRVKANFSSAKRYDEFASYHNITLKMIASEIDLYLKSVSGLPCLKNNPVNILDAGCGTGSSLFYLKNSVDKNINYFGIDIAKGLLHQSKLKLSSETLAFLPSGYPAAYRSGIKITAGNVSAGTYLICADCENLPFKEKKFEIIFSNMAIHWLNDIPSFFTAVKNTLKDNGLFISSFLAEGTLNELNDCYERVMAGAGKTGSIKLHSFPKEEYIRDILIKNGFDVERPLFIKYLEYSDSLFSILKKINMLGARNSLAGSEKSESSERYKLLKHVLREYDCLYKTPDNKVFATYNIAYVSARKK